MPHAISESDDSTMSNEEKEVEINMTAARVATNFHNPFQDKYKLYIMHLFYAFTSRMWEFAIVLLIAEMTNNSLFVVAISGFLSSFSIFIFMPTIGKWLDKNDRMLCVKYALGTKIIAISIAYIICALVDTYFTISTVSSDNSSTNVDTVNNDITHSSDQAIIPWPVYLLPVIYAVASLAFSSVTQSIEKDWIVELSDKDSDWLSTTNSVMSQIDLAWYTLLYTNLIDVLF